MQTCQRQRPTPAEVLQPSDKSSSGRNGDDNDDDPADTLAEAAEAAAMVALPDEEAHRRCERLGCGGQHVAFSDSSLIITGVGSPTSTGNAAASGGVGKRLYVLPRLSVRRYTLHEDFQYVLLTLTMLLPALAASISFLSHGLAACFLRHRAILLLVLLVCITGQLIVLHAQLSTSHSASATSWLLPLALPFVTAVDLLTSRRLGSFSFRLPVAALTFTAPVFMLLELQRLRAAPQPMVPTGAWAPEWPEWMGLCTARKGCGIS